MHDLVEQHLVEGHVHVSGMWRIRKHVPLRVVQAVRRHRSASIPDEVEQRRRLWTLYAINFLNAVGIPLGCIHTRVHSGSLTPWL